MVSQWYPPDEYADMGNGARDNPKCRGQFTKNQPDYSIRRPVNVAGLLNSAAAQTVSSSGHIT